MANASEAGAPVCRSVFRCYIGVDLPNVNPNLKHSPSPFTDERLAAVAGDRPDVAVITRSRPTGAGMFYRGHRRVQKERCWRRNARSFTDGGDWSSTSGSAAPRCDPAELDKNFGCHACVPGGAHHPNAHATTKRDTPSTRPGRDLHATATGLLALRKRRWSTSRALMLSPCIPRYRRHFYQPAEEHRQVLFSLRRATDAAEGREPTTQTNYMTIRRPARCATSTSASVRIGMPSRLQPGTASPMRRIHLIYIRHHRHQPDWLPRSPGRKTVATPRLTTSGVEMFRYWRSGRRFSVSSSAGAIVSLRPPSHHGGRPPNQNRRRGSRRRRRP